MINYFKEFYLYLLLLHIKNWKTKQKNMRATSIAKPSETQKITAIMMLDASNLVKTIQLMSVPRSKIVPLNVLSAPKTIPQTSRDTQHTSRPKKLSQRSSLSKSEILTLNPESNHMHKLPNCQNMNTIQISYTFSNFV